MTSVLARGLAFGVSLAASPELVPEPHDGAADVQAPEPEGDADGSGTGSEAERDPEAITSLGDELAVVAAKHFTEGRRLFDAREYVAAAREFERSHAAVRSGMTLYNIALSYERGGETVKALEAALRYLALPSCDDPDRCAAKREEVERTVERLRRAVGELALVIEPGVEIREIHVDGVVVPLDDFPLVREPGSVKVEVSGYRDGEEMTKVVRLVAGETDTVYVTPFRPVFEADEGTPPQGPSGPPNPPDDPKRRQTLKAGFFALMGSTVASGAATAALGGFSMRAKRAFEGSQCGDMCVYTADPDGTNAETETPFPYAKQDRFERLRLATNVMIGVTAGLAVATAVVGLFAFAERGSSQQRASLTHRRPGGRRVHARVSPWALQLDF